MQTHARACACAAHGAEALPGQHPGQSTLDKGPALHSLVEAVHAHKGSPWTAPWTKQDPRQAQTQPSLDRPGPAREQRGGNRYPDKHGPLHSTHPRQARALCTWEGALPSRGSNRAPPHPRSLSQKPTHSTPLALHKTAATVDTHSVPPLRKGRTDGGRSVCEIDSLG